MRYQTSYESNTPLEKLGKFQAFFPLWLSQTTRQAMSAHRGLAVVSHVTTGKEVNYHSQNKYTLNLKHQG
jgi:hypothetical protein